MSIYHVWGVRWLPSEYPLDPIEFDWNVMSLWKLDPGKRVDRRTELDGTDSLWIHMKKDAEAFYGEQRTDSSYMYISWNGNIEEIYISTINSIDEIFGEITLDFSWEDTFVLNNTKESKDPTQVASWGTSFKIGKRMFIAPKNPPTLIKWKKLDLINPEVLTTEICEKNIGQIKAYCEELLWTTVFDDNWHLSQTIQKVLTWFWEDILEEVKQYNS